MSNIWADANVRSLPEAGLSREQVKEALADRASQDEQNLESRMMTGGTYPAGEDVLEVAKEAYSQFFSTNPLYSSVFKSLARMEREVIRMAGALHHGSDVHGSITSGGSESILMGVKIARDRARVRHPEIDRPEMVVPMSAHPAFWKAAHYFGLKLVEVPLTADLLVDVDTYLERVSENSVLLVASAPSLTLGMVDPVEELAAFAAERDLSCHVDACVGGYFLPFLERLGHEIPVFDFRLPGVTTMSADLHKFGFAAKGASSILCRDAEVFEHQVFKFGAPHRPDDWYYTPSMTGTRPGGAVAAAWAVMMYLGMKGYMRLANQAMEDTRRLWNGINSIDGLQVLGAPVMTVFGCGSTDSALDIFAVAEGMEQRGWLVAREEWPSRSIRFMQSPGHGPYMDAYLADLREVAELVRHGDIVSSGGRATYT